MRRLQLIVPLHVRPQERTGAALSPAVVAAAPRKPFTQASAAATGGLRMDQETGSGTTAAATTAAAAVGESGVDGG